MVTCNSNADVSMLNIVISTEIRQTTTKGKWLTLMTRDPEGKNWNEIIYKPKNFQKKNCFLAMENKSLCPHPVLTVSTQPRLTSFVGTWMKCVWGSLSEKAACTFWKRVPGLYFWFTEKDSTTGSIIFMNTNS